jgi:hypothetical protein
VSIVRVNFLLAPIGLTGVDSTPQAEEQVGFVRRLYGKCKITHPFPFESLNTMTTNTASSLRHVVLFSFKDKATADQVNAVIADFGKLKGAIPGITAYEWGTNVSPEGLNDGFTHCFTLTFGSAEDRDAYIAHAAHQAFVATLGAVLERSLVLDYWTH